MSSFWLLIIILDLIIFCLRINDIIGVLERINLIDLLYVNISNIDSFMKNFLLL